MSRLIELTETFLSRELSSIELSEFHTLLEAKAEGFEESMKLMETEGLLRGILTDLNPQKAVMERIFSLDEDETAQAVMSSIRQKKKIRKPNLREVRRREKISPYPIIFSIAAILILGFFIYTGLKKTPQNTVAVIDSLEGTGHLHRVAKFFDLKSGLTVNSGDKIVSDDKVNLRLTDESSITLAANSSFKIVKAGDNWKLSLEKGTVYASVKPQKGTFRVKTPAMEVTVVGTQFAVSHNSGESQVKVTKGKVKSVAAGESFDISAGQEFKAVKGRVIYKPRKIATSTEVIKFDFEGGVLPKGLQNAAVKNSKFFPPGNKSKFAVQGLPSSEKGGEYRVKGIQQIDRSGIFTYRKETVIRFDYWISPKCFWLGVWMRCEKRNINVYEAIKPVFNKWASAEVPLSTLVSKTNGERLKPGDVINRWHLMTNSDNDAEIYLDNIRIEYR